MSIFDFEMDIHIDEAEKTMTIRSKVADQEQLNILMRALDVRRHKLPQSAEDRGTRPPPVPAVPSRRDDYGSEDDILCIIRGAGGVMRHTALLNRLQGRRHGPRFDTSMLRAVMQELCRKDLVKEDTDHHPRGSAPSIVYRLASVPREERPEETSRRSVPVDCKVLRIITDAGGKETRRNIYRRLPKELNLRQVLDQMVREGALLESKTNPAGGGGVTVWYSLLAPTHGRSGSHGQPKEGRTA